MLSTAEKSPPMNSQALLPRESVAQSLRARLPIARDDILLFSLVVIYVSSIYLVEATFWLEGMVNIQWNYRFLNLPTLAFYSLVLFVQLLKRRLQVRHAKNSWRSAWSTIRVEYLSPARVAGCIVIYIAFPLFMSAFTSMKQMIPEVHLFAWDHVFIQIDYILHGESHPWELIHSLFGYPIVTLVLDRIYMSWFFLLYGLSLWMAVSTQRQLRLQYFLCLGFIWAILGNLLATIFSSVGPCYIANVTHDSNPYAAQLTYLQSVHNQYFLWAIKNQEEIWHLYSSKTLVFFGGISAMPSIHVAGATLFALTGWKAHRWIGIPLVLNLVFTQIASVHLAWHYAIDGYFSCILTCILWVVVGQSLKVMEKKERLQSLLFRNGEFEARNLANII